MYKITKHSVYCFLHHNGGSSYAMFHLTYHRNLMGQYHHSVLQDRQGHLHNRRYRLLLPKKQYSYYLLVFLPAHSVLQ